jgi:hypothetical protein
MLLRIKICYGILTHMDVYTMEYIFTIEPLNFIPLQGLLAATLATIRINILSKPSLCAQEGRECGMHGLRFLYL